MTELVRMDVPDASLPRATFHKLPDSPIGQPPLLPDPDCRGIGVVVISTDPKVAVDGLSRPCPKWALTRAAALTQDVGHPLIEINVLDTEPGEFGQTHPRVQQHPHDGGITSGLKTGSLTSLQEGFDVVGSEHLRRLLRNLWPLHVRHR